MAKPEVMASHSCGMLESPREVGGRLASCNLEIDGGRVVAFLFKESAQDCINVAFGRGEQLLQACEDACEGFA